MGFPSKVRHAVDAEPSIVLRQLADGPETASAVENAISLNVNTTPYWSNGAIPFQQAAVVFRVTAIDRTTGDETYVALGPDGKLVKVKRNIETGESDPA